MEAKKKPIKKELEALRLESKDLANRTAQLEAILILYGEIIAVPGLEHLVKKILDVIMEVYGGRNVIIYYLLDGAWQYRDIYDVREEVEIEKNPLVFQAVNGKKYLHREHKESEPILPGGIKMEEHTCVFPLLVGDNVVGTIVLEGMAVYEEKIVKELETFFRYFSLALNNEIVNYANLQEAYGELDQIFQSNPDGMAFTDAGCNIVRINKALLDLLELEENECIGKKCYELIGCPYCETKGCTLTIEHSEVERQEADLEIGNKSGDVISCIVTASRLKNKSGKFVGIIINIKDITDRKRAEEQVKHALREKETMLREIHHRVKNNLQIIYSLIRLQSNFLQSKEAVEYFKDTAARIRSMGIIHEILYQSEEFSGIDFMEFVKSLGNELSGLYHAEHMYTDVDIHIDPPPGEPVTLDIDTAIPCGLIINELVSNSLKYAFPKGGKGEIRIGLSPDEKGRYVLFVRDNGVGLPADIDISAPQTLKSLGLQLVTTLATQIEGSIEIDRNGGTTFFITFDKPG